MSHLPRISCIAIIGKHVRSVNAFLTSQNNPLFLKTFAKTPSTPMQKPENLASLLPAPSPALKYHFLAHSALDIIEERIVSGAKTIDTYFGLLHVLEEVSVYGFLTNTLVKIIVMIEGGDGSGGLRDSDVKSVSMLWTQEIMVGYETYP
jgi:trafficking protein particle complex subunit 2